MQKIQWQFPFTAFSVRIEYQDKDGSSASTILRLVRVDIPDMHFNGVMGPQLHRAKRIIESESWRFWNQSLFSTGEPSDTIRPAR